MILKFRKKTQNSSAAPASVPAATEEVLPQSPQLLVSAVSLLGGRKTQQDALDYRILPNGALAAAVCDGMGGLNGGEIAARAACHGFFREYERICADTAPDIKQLARKLDQQVSALREANGQPLDAGSAIVAAVVKDDYFCWLSVGDSRIGLLRNGELVWLNRLHNYQLELDEALRIGAMDPAEYQAELPKGRALLSYLGCGELKYIDAQYDVPWIHGDQLLLCSDGFYDLLSSQELSSILTKETPDLIPALMPRLEAKGKSADNASAIIIQYKEGAK